jgi:hypothetical protein
MKLNIIYTLKGKPFPTLEDAIHDAIIEGIKENIEENISHFSKEIIRSGGTVKVDINDNYDWQIQVKNVPAELIDKIKMALINVEPGLSV